MTDTLTRALQALERALEDSQALINTSAKRGAERAAAAGRLKQMRDDLAAGERAAEELRAMLARPRGELPEPAGHFFETHIAEDGKPRYAHIDIAHRNNPDVVRLYYEADMLAALARHSGALPELPEPDVTALSDYFLRDGSRQSLAFTHDQMHAHARAALAAASEPTTAEGLTRWAMCPETETPFSHCPTQRVPCEAAASAPGAPAWWQCSACKCLQHVMGVGEADNWCVACGAVDRMEPLFSASPPPPTEQPEQARQPLTQRQIEDILNASSEADEGPSQLIWRVESALGVGQARQPLTDEQIARITTESTGWQNPTPPFFALARAIESAHGILPATEQKRPLTDGWRPIESAPKDGTRVLCVWACAWGPMVYEGWCQGVGTARDGGDFWRSHSLVPVSGRPTHWQPLPAPPIEPAKDAG